jgi:hypothetical protein
MRKDLPEKRGKQLQQKQQKQKGKRNKDHTAPENRPQRTHDDLMKDMERLKMLLV